MSDGGTGNKLLNWWLLDSSCRCLTSDPPGIPANHDEFSPGTDDGGGSDDTSSGSDADGEITPRQELLLQEQMSTIRSLKNEGIGVARLQAAVVGVAATGLAVLNEGYDLIAKIFTLENSIDYIGFGALVVGIGLLLSVFLLVPRPHTDRRLVVTEVGVVPPTGVVCFPSSDDDVDRCIRWNRVVIDCTEKRLQQLQQKNVFGVVLLGAGIVTQYVP